MELLRTILFFVGIFAGHLGLSIDPNMLQFAQSFGLVLFVYELGLQVGPGFISSFKHGGMKLNLLGIGLSLYLTYLGLSSGTHFFQTIMRPEGLLWVGIGLIITVIPVLIMAWISMRLFPTTVRRFHTQQFTLSECSSEWSLSK